MIRRRTSAALTLILSFCCAATTLRAAPDGGDAPALIQALAHPDPRERERAEKGLIALGAAAREPVVEATKSDDPELASRARAVLAKLPWSLSTDSRNARQLLARYGQPGQERGPIIAKLVETREISVLLRLLEEEPETETRWTIANQLSSRKAVPDLELDRRLKDVSTDSTNAPLVYLAGKRAEGPDRPRALKLYRRVIELESVVSAPALGEVFDAFDELIREAMRKSDHAGAIALLREQARRMTGSTLARPAGARLLAMHAYLGPMPGFTEDLAALREIAGPITVADAIARVYDAVGLAPPPLLVVGTRASPAIPLETRLWAGEFLYQQRLADQAEFELSCIVAGRKNKPQQDELERGAPAFYDYDAVEAYARAYLSRLAGDRGDDLAAAEHLRAQAELRGEHAALTRGRPNPNANANANANPNPNAERNDREFAELHWRYLRAARTAGDHAKVREHLDVLKTLTPENTDIVNDVVPLLKEAGQVEAARAMFDKTYKRLREAVEADPGEPEPMNNLAWLCARTGERLPEALDLATQAVALDPDNAAYLDTAAEANFRVGNIDEAIRLETKGLEGRPNDKFMREQLERFKAAKK